MTADSYSQAMNHDCIGCTRIVRLAPGEVERLLARYLETASDAVADDSTYAARLAVCDNCPDLRYGTTCRHCGCLVAVRAKIAGKSCPAPLSRWNATAENMTDPISSPSQFAGQSTHRPDQPAD